MNRRAHADRNRSRRPRQLELARTGGWGGKRKGAGRKRRALRPMVEHRRRPRVTRHLPVHVTLRVLPHVWNLRSRRSFNALRQAMSVGGNQFGMRLCDFSIQGNHLHFILEADDTRALQRGMRGLTIRIAKALNRLMGRRGRVLADRYHVHVLKTPIEVKHALHYVRYNDDSHRARRGDRRVGMPDVFSSLHPNHDVVLAFATSHLLELAYRALGRPHRPRRSEPREPDRRRRRLRAE